MDITIEYNLSVYERPTITWGQFRQLLIGRFRGFDSWGTHKNTFSPWGKHKYVSYDENKNVSYLENLNVI